jgi:predicted outer membrane repeat protein
MGLSLAGVIFLVSTAEARVYYVMKGAAGTGDSWDNALGSITAGLVAAAMWDDIWVKSATYTEAITLKSGVGLYGGFAGTETSRAQRDWAANVTAIDATGKQMRAVTANVVNAATVDGFVITGGWSPDGGGVYCQQSSPTLANCTITGNTAAPWDGGGIYCISSSPRITNCRIAGNIAQRHGGGVYCKSCSLQVTNCTIMGNTAKMGGGMACSDS